MKRHWPGISNRTLCGKHLEIHTVPIVSVLADLTCKVCQLRIRRMARRDPWWATQLAAVPWAKKQSAPAG
jgi:hypothetical protein